MTRRDPLATALLVLLFVAGCAERGAPADDAAPDTTAAVDATAPSGAMPDSLVLDDPLLLVRELPLGSSYAEVAQRVPEVSDLAAEGAGTGLAEAFVPVHVLGRASRLELNFEDERLYSLYYRPDPLPCDTAAAHYEALQADYDARLGAHREEVQDEGAYAARTTFWSGDAFDVAATLSRQDETCRLSWGIQ